MISLRHTFADVFLAKCFYLCTSFNIPLKPSELALPSMQTPPLPPGLHPHPAS